MLHIQASDSPELIQAAVEAAGYTLAPEAKPAEAAGEPAGTTEEAKVEEQEPASPETPGEAAGESSEDESAAAPEAATQEQAPPANGKRKPGSQVEKEKRLAAEAENQRLREQLEALKQKPSAETAGAPTPAETPKVEAEAAPKWEDFEKSDDQHRDYTAAVAAHAARKEIREQKATEQQAEAKRQNDAYADREAKRWNDQLSAARTAHADFDQALSEKVFSQAMLNIIQEPSTLNGAELAYALAKHPEEALKIAQASEYPTGSTPDQVRSAHFVAARALARFEDKYLASPAVEQSTPPAPAVNVTPIKSPRPPAKVGGSAPATSGAVDYEKVASSSSPIRDYEASLQRQRAG